MINNAKIIIVTPVYEDINALTILLAEIYALYKNTAYIVAVDDGSVYQPLDKNILKTNKLSGTILKLHRNVGHQRAIAIGLGFVAEKSTNDPKVVIMDCDGEDRPKNIVNLISELQKSEVDIVVAQRSKRVESLRFKFFYFFYKIFFLLMTGKKIRFGNFMVLSKSAVLRLVAMQELSIHLAGAVLASKLRTLLIPIDRGARYNGQSKMNFVGLALHGFKGLMVFAEDVLVRVGIMCAFIAGLSIFSAILAICLKVAGFATPGWFSVALGILILIFLQTGVLALMTLMLTGIVRSGNVTNKTIYQDFISEVIEVSDRL